MESTSKGYKHIIITDIFKNNETLLLYYKYFFSLQQSNSLFILIGNIAEHQCVHIGMWVCNNLCDRVGVNFHLFEHLFFELKTFRSRYQFSQTLDNVPVY